MYFIARAVYFIHGPPVFSILGQQRGAGAAAAPPLVPRRLRGARARGADFSRFPPAVAHRLLLSALTASDRVTRDRPVALRVRRTDRGAKGIYLG